MAAVTAPFANTALEYAAKAQETDVNNPDIYFLIAKIYNALNDPQKAKENMDNALKYSLNRKDILITSILWKANDAETAKEALEEIKEYQKQDPESRLAVFIEGLALLKQGKKQNAITVFKKIQNSNEDSFIKEVAKEIIKEN